MLLIRALLLALLASTAAAQTATHTPAPTATPTFVPRALVAGFAAGDATTPVWTPAGGAGAVWLATPGEWAADVRPTPGTAKHLTTAVSGSGASYTLGLGERIATGGVPPGTCVGGSQNGNACTYGTGGACASGGGECSTINETHLAYVLNGANVMGFLTLGSDGKVRAYYGTTGKECTSNSLYKYTACSSDADCPSDVGGNPGEASCSASAFAVTGALPTDTNIILGLAQTADAGGARPHEATITLTQDYVVKGSQTRWQGTCSGSTGTTTINGKACGATADCTALCGNVAGCSTAGTCGGSNIGTPTAVRLGTTQTGSSLQATTAYPLHAVFVFNGADPSSRYSKVVPLWPTSDGGTNDWTDAGSSACSSHYQCEDDTAAGGALDGDTTTLRASQPGETEIWGLTDYSLGGGEYAISATAWASLKEQDDNSQNSGKLIGLGLRNAAAGETMGTSHELANFDTGYRTFPGPLTMAMPGGGAWDINAIRGVARFTGGSGGTSYRVRSSAFVAEVEVGLPQPTPGTNVFPDANGDGRKRLCVVGDSIMNDPTMYEALLGAAEEPTDILKCAQGGRKIGDVAANWSAILSGSTSGAFPCAVQRGEAGNCDVALLHIGANNSSYVSEADNDGKCYQRGCVGGSNAGAACKTSATCPGGTCTDDAGPQHGAACDNPFGVENRNAVSWVTSSYCNRSDAIGECCAGVGCTTSRCGGAGVCVGGSNPKTLCTGDGSQCTGGGTCQQLSSTGGTAEVDDLTYGFGNCVRGDPTTPTCPLGVCVRKVSTAYLDAALTALLDAAAARTGSQAVTVGLLGNVEPCVSPAAEKKCVGGTNHGVTCTADSGCSGGACRVLGTRKAWNNGLDRAQWLRRWMARTAAQRGLPFFDLGGYLRRLAGENPDENLRDCVHLSDEGQTRAGEGIAMCIEATPAPENQCGFGS